MRFWVVLFFVLLLPFQLAWSAASGYCKHETDSQQSQHFGHHFHTHQGESEAQKAAPGEVLADADCASCHAGAAAIPTAFHTREFATASCLSDSVSSHPFTSVLARAPDRPQWLRLV